MRILHTSDWHLGQDFHGVPRDHEHEAFLSWLEAVLEEHGVDALIVAGDVFDSQNPPISAQRQLYRFIAAVRRRCPDLDVVLVGGNHDSAGRLEAPGPLLDAFGVRVVGSLPRRPDGTIDVERLAVPLRDSNGVVRAICAAVPFLRLADLPVRDTEDGGDPLVEGVRAVYAEVLGAIYARLSPGQALIATGHCYMTGGELSELSERRILGGNQHALPADIFPEGVAYVALGHLHKAQRVAGRDGVRYSGAPLPLSVTERDYRHQVMLVDLEGGAARVGAIEVPRRVDIVRVPPRGAATPEAALAALRAIEADPGRPRAEWPYLHVAVAADGPRPGLRRDVEEAIEGKGLRLVRIDRGEERPPALLASESLPDLETLHPEEVFVRCWSAAYGAAPPEPALGAFRDLLEGIECGGEGA